MIDLMKKMIEALCFLLIFLSLSFAHGPHLSCGTIDPSSADELRDANRMAKRMAKRIAQRQRIAEQRPTVLIDAVFQIIDNSEGSSLASRLWTTSTIEEEVNRINQHFAQTNFRFQVSSIIHTKSDRWASAGFNDGELVNEMVANLRIGGADVVNIFVNDGLCSKMAGVASFPVDYGFFPNNHASFRDRILICSSRIGLLQEGTFDTVITHELGHWMGLRHPFQGNSCSTDNPNDLVADTPVMLSPTIDGCNLEKDTCPGRDGFDPVLNFMDYSVCRNKFTAGQAARMYEQFDEYRRKIDPCPEATVIFSVHFDDSPDKMLIDFAEFSDEEIYIINLKSLDTEPQVQYANQEVRREMCLISQVLYALVIRDLDSDGFDANGYVSVDVNGRQVFRETSFNVDSAINFFVPDTCHEEQSILVLEMKLDDNPSDISWDILNMDENDLVVDRDTTVAYTRLANQSLYYDKCLDPGDYILTIYDTAGDGIQDPGYFKLLLDGREIRTGGGSDGFTTAQAFYFTVREPIFTESVQSSIGCFSGSTKVTTKDKGTVMMRELVLGDMVHTGGGIYEPVYTFGHYNQIAWGTFLRIETSKSSLEITADHMVFVRNSGFIPAMMLVIGDLLIDSNMEVLAVESITSNVSALGVFAPFTPSGMLIVNGILASTYVSFEQSPTVKMLGVNFSYHWLANLSESPRRLVCHVLGKCTAESYNEDGVSTWHSVARTVYQWLLNQNFVVVQVGFMFAIAILGLVSIFEFFISSVFTVLLAMCVFAVVSRQSIFTKIQSIIRCIP